MVILDTGSQKSYVTKKATELIEAQIHHQEKLKIEGFGGNTSETTNHVVIQVNISRASTAINLNAITVERICLSVRNQSKLNLVKALPDVVINNLADDVEEDQADIHLLIRMDHYWDIVEGETVRGKNGVVAVKTCLSYVISRHRECHVEGETVRGKNGAVAVKTCLSYVISRHRECHGARMKTLITKALLPQIWTM